MSFVPTPSVARSATPAEWARFIRVHQWSKNLLVFVPLVFGHAYDEPAAVAACMLAFLSLSFVASGTYVANDILDAESDRLHPTKRTRLVASGRVGLAAAAAAGVTLVGAGLLMACFARPTFLAMVVLYASTSVAYSLRIKRIPMADVVTVGLLFTLRVAAGAEVAGLNQSAWLLSFSALFFLSLAFAKRHAEVHSAFREGRMVSGRGYMPEDWPLTLASGVASLFASLVVLSLYLSEEAVRVGVYDRPAFLWAAPVLVATWALRIWHLAHRGDLKGDPVSFALRDTTSLVMGGVVLATFAVAVS